METKIRKTKYGTLVLAVLFVSAIFSIWGPDVTVGLSWRPSLIELRYVLDSDAWGRGFPGQKFQCPPDVSLPTHTSCERREWIRWDWVVRNFWINILIWGALLFGIELTKRKLSRETDE